MKDTSPTRHNAQISLAEKNQNYDYLEVFDEAGDQMCESTVRSGIRSLNRFHALRWLLLEARVRVFKLSQFAE
jgi:hypothetical protein